MNEKFFFGYDGWMSIRALFLPRHIARDDKVICKYGSKKALDLES